MDAYFYVRFLRMMLKVFVPIWLVSWVVLLPITSANSNSGKSGLDRFTFGNIGPDMQTRYAAHIILVWLFTSMLLFSCIHIFNELIALFYLNSMDMLQYQERNATFRHCSSAVPCLS